MKKRQRRKRTNPGKQIHKAPMKLCPVVNIDMLKMKDRAGDYQDENVENLIASMLRDPRGGESWFMRRLEAAKNMAKIPDHGQRWYG